MKYTVGLDNGGTVIKAAVFDEAGRQMSVASERVALIAPRPGWTERDMEELWQANARAVKAAVQNAGVAARDVVAVGISGHGKGMYLLGKDGAPVYLGIVSTDNRAEGEELLCRKSGIEAKSARTNYQRVLASQPVCLLRYFKKYLPDVYGKIGWVLSVKDYIRYRMTGEIFAERTDSSGTNLFNLKTGAYDEALLTLFGIPEIAGALPPVLNSSDLAGRVTEKAAAETGLAAGTAVAAGMFDIDACALGMGVTDETDLTVIAGTWSINEYLSKNPVTDGSVAMNSYYCIPGYYLIEECSPTSAGNLDWVLNRFFSGEIEAAGGMNAAFYRRVNELAEQASPEKCDVIFLPFLFASNETPGMKSAFLNLDAAYGKAEILRAVYEGVVFSHKSHIDKLFASGYRPQAIRLAGGAANSAVWSQCFSDALGYPVKTIVGRENGCFGAAVAAGVAGGLYRDYESAVEASVRFDAVYQPNPERTELYRKKYAAYRRAVDALGRFYE